jgi:hypothetical protein
MSQKENLVEVILTSGEGEKEFRMHVMISKEAEKRALELLDKENAPISNDRRTKLIRQAMGEFPVKKK